MFCSCKSCWQYINLLYAKIEQQAERDQRFEDQACEKQLIFDIL